MDINRDQRGDVLVLQPLGNLDTRTSFEFEREVVEILDEGVRLFVVDLVRVDQLTSSGIRVFLMLAKKLAGLDGGLVLCSLSEHVHTILEISGLTKQFALADSVDDAVQRLSSPGRTRASKLTGLVSRVVRGGSGSPAARRATARPSKLAAEAVRVLETGRP